MAGHPHWSHCHLRWVCFSPLSLQSPQRRRSHKHGFDCCSVSYTWSNIRRKVQLDSHVVVSPHIKVSFQLVPVRIFWYTWSLLWLSALEEEDAVANDAAVDADEDKEEEGAKDTWTLRCEEDNKHYQTHNKQYIYWWQRRWRWYARQLSRCFDISRYLTYKCFSFDSKQTDSRCVKNAGSKRSKTCGSSPLLQ